MFTFIKSLLEDDEKTVSVTDKELDKVVDKESDNEVDKEADEKDDINKEEDKEDSDRQGIIRYVKGARLVYKRKNPEGLYDELWLYRTSGLKTDELIKKAIIAGTDIDEKTGEAEDGSQSFDLWISGDVTLLKISNLPE